MYIFSDVYTVGVTPKCKEQIKNHKSDITHTTINRL